MKKAILYLFFFLLLLYQAKDGIILVVFKINQNYIAQNLCENRNRPELKCNGNCVFMKAINESHKNDKEFPALSLVGKTSFFVILDKFFHFKAIENLNVLHNDYYVTKRTKSFIHFIFHPPQLV